MPGVETHIGVRSSFGGGGCSWGQWWGRDSAGNGGHQQHRGRSRALYCVVQGLDGLDSRARTHLTGLACGEDARVTPCGEIMR